MSKKKEQVVAPADPAMPKVIVKKRGGCGSFFVGFMFSFVLLVVFFVGGGLYLYYNFSISTVETMLGLTIPVEGELKNMSIKQLLEEKDKLVNASISTLESDFGVEIPDLIPGTKLNIGPVYEETITFQGKDTKVKDIRIQDIANSLDEFVEQVLPKMYKHVTVGQVLETAQTTILDDLGYPALAEEFYNTGTTTEPVYKKLADLTIEQALELVPEYFSQDTLTVQQALDAFGVDLLPYPEEGQVDVYATLRDIKVKDLNAESLTHEITGEIIKKLVDLEAYEFTNKEEFDKTSVYELGNFLLTLSLGDFVSVEGVLVTPETKESQLFKNIDGKTKLVNFREAISNLKLNQIFETADITTIETTFVGAGELTVAEFLAEKTGDFATLTGLSMENRVGYINVIMSATADSWAEDLSTAKIYDLLGKADYVTPIAGLGDTTLEQITQSANAVKLLLENFGTLGELIGSADASEGIFGIISSVSLVDMLEQPADAIMDKLTTSAKPLKDLLGITFDENTKPILQKIMTLTVGDLFSGSADTAIMNKLKEGSLGDLLEIENPTGVLAKIAGMSMADLLGESSGDAFTTVINGLTLKDVFGEYADQSAVLKDLYDLTPDDKGGMKVTSVFDNITNVKLASVFGSSNTGILGGLLKIDANMKISEVFNNINNVEITYIFGTPAENSGILYGLLQVKSNMTVSEVFDSINQVKLQYVFASKPVIFDYVSNFNSLTIGTMGNMQFDTANMTIGTLDEIGMISWETLTVGGYALTEPQWNSIKETPLLDIIVGGIEKKLEQLASS